MSTRSSHATLATGARTLRVRTNPLRALLDLLVTWNERARQRHQLRSFDDRMLRDIGVTRTDARVESAKPFWRP